MKFLKQIKALLEGVFIVFKHLFKKSVTLQYPEERPVVPEKFRGGHTLNGCIGCGICRKVCPCDAITIENEGKNVTSYKINLRKCMFCGNCQYYCPVSAIKLGEKFELATAFEEELQVELVNDSNKSKEDNK